MANRFSTKNSAQPRQTLPVVLAARIVAGIFEQKLATRFIESYAAKFERAELVIHKERNRELEQILGREILLALLARVGSNLEERSRSRVRRQPANKTSTPDPNRFLRELLACIGRDLRWSAGDVMEVQGELNLYREIMAKNSTPVARTASGTSLGGGFRRSANGGPFVDRCAFVLDASMMENARVGAAKLLREIEARADQMLEECLQADSIRK